MTETVQRGRERRFSVGVVEGVGVSCGVSEQRFVQNLLFRAAEKESARAGGCPMTNASPGFRNFPETGAIFLPEGERPGRKQKKKVRSGSQKPQRAGRHIVFTVFVRRSGDRSGLQTERKNRIGSPWKEGEGGRRRSGVTDRQTGERRGRRADGVLRFPEGGTVGCSCGCELPLLCACCCDVPRVGNPLRQKKKADPEGSTLYIQEIIF